MVPTEGERELLTVVPTEGECKPLTVVPTEGERKPLTVVPDRRGAQASDHPQRGTRSVLIVRGAA